MPKTRIEDLALFGGPREFATELHVGTPNIGDRDAILRSVADLLDRRWLTNHGPLMLEFQRRVATIAGAPHCVLTCNGTIGLELAIRALGLTSEVIVPAFTFVATAHALTWLGLTPVFCDVDPRTHHVDPAAVERCITPRTTGIIGVHLWGKPCDIDGLARVADRHRLRLVFDAAHAFGCAYKGRPIATYGDATIFSFHATKIVNTFEGGAVVTNHDEVARRLELMSAFGFVDCDRIESVGTNAKLSEPAAAMGLASLDAFDTFVRVNAENHAAYVRGLSNVPGVSLVHFDAADKPNYHYIVLQIDEPTAGLSRDQLHAVLWAENVLARRYFYPGCHRVEPYRSLNPSSSLQHTEHVASRVLCLPTGTNTTIDQIEGICALVCFALQNPSAIRKRLTTAMPPYGSKNSAARLGSKLVS